MKVYRIDVKLCGTAYVRAKDEKDARRKAKEFSKEWFEVRGDVVSHLSFDDPRLPDVSLSPAIAGHGIWPGSQLELAYDTEEEME